MLNKIHFTFSLEFWLISQLERFLCFRLIYRSEIPDLFLPFTGKNSFSHQIRIFARFQSSDFRCLWFFLDFWMQGKKRHLLLVIWSNIMLSSDEVVKLWFDIHQMSKCWKMLEEPVLCSLQLLKMKHWPIFYWKFQILPYVNFVARFHLALRINNVNTTSDKWTQSRTYFPDTISCVILEFWGI